MKSRSSLSHPVALSQRTLRIFVFAILALSACSAPVVRPQKFIGNEFPSISGKALDGTVVTAPASFKGQPTVLLIGYLQKAQFDIDRWILGLLQADVKVRIVELPTIAGMMPEMVQGFIDNGMRRGIPKEDWASVITIYEDAHKIIEVIGNENPQNAHVVLLDAEGRIIWSADRGYSAAQILELKALVGS